jgi:hypothetical protein
MHRERRWGAVAKSEKRSKMPFNLWDGGWKIWYKLLKYNKCIERDVEVLLQKVRKEVKRLSIYEMEVQKYNTSCWNTINA